MVSIVKYLLLLTPIWLAGCTPTKQYIAHTEFVVLVPEAIETPAPPVPNKYRVTEPMTSEYNFKTFQINHLQLVDYITLLHRNLKYYELQLNELNQRKASIENENRASK